MIELTEISLPDACIRYEQITGKKITESIFINLAFNRKIKLLVLYDGKVQHIGDSGEKIIDYYGWLVPLPRFYAELVANGSCNVDMLTNFQEDAMFTLLKGVSKSIRITKDNLFINGETLNYLSGFEPAYNKEKGRREKQISFIQNFITQQKWELHDLPLGAKTTAKTYCISNNPKLFTENGFVRAWQEGLDRGLFRLHDHDKFSGRG
ncbi:MULTISPECIES: hypothetical protein [unclassified Methylophilus]|uniref:hypothetical protein n=1 Tax=unclassified Methylophilus TaxID=2630143 RepID=UPI0012E3545D|nr:MULTISPECIES: hypothetical protein [unclassified Methylophilus]